MAMRRFVGELFIVNKEVTVALTGWADDETWGRLDLGFRGTSHHHVPFHSHTLSLNIIPPLLG